MFCTQVRIGTARDALRYHAVGVWSSRVMQGWAADGRDASAIPSAGSVGDTAQLGRSGDPMTCGEWLATNTWVQVSGVRDALRYRAVCVRVVRGQDWAGLPTVGTLRRYLPIELGCA